MSQLQVVWIVRDSGTEFKDTKTNTKFEVKISDLAMFCHNWRHRWHEFRFAVYADEKDALEDYKSRRCML